MYSTARWYAYLSTYQLTSCGADRLEIPLDDDDADEDDDAIVSCDADAPRGLVSAGAGWETTGSRTCLVGVLLSDDVIEAGGRCADKLLAGLPAATRTGFTWNTWRTGLR